VNLVGNGLIVHCSGPNREPTKTHFPECEALVEARTRDALRLGRSLSFPICQALWPGLLEAEGLKRKVRSMSATRGRDLVGVTVVGNRGLSRQANEGISA
jgi:hypothetical protein